MVASSFSHEIVSTVSPARLWHAVVKDAHNLLPKLVPNIVSSIVILEGDGGVGTIRQSNFTEVIKDFSFVKERIDKIDDENHILKYTVIEGGLVGTKVKSSAFEFIFEGTDDGGSLCKLNGDIETLGDIIPTEAENKEMIEGMVGLFKVIEGYLISNPEVYA